MKTLFHVLTRLASLSGLMLSLASTAFSAPFAFVSGTSKTLTPTALAMAQKTVTRGQIAADKKTLTFGQRAIRLVAVTGPDNDMLSYRIAGLRNPTLVLPRGATLNMLFVNMDGDMFHNIRFGAWRAAYPPVTDALLKTSVGTPPLPHGTETMHHAEELTLHAPSTPGKYAYFCTVRGHAPGGMWGTILVR